MHSGMYGMYALQESVRQMRGTAPAQVPGAKISIAHGVGGMFAASGTDRAQQRARMSASAGCGDPSMSYDAPFAGLKVVDLSQGVAGPYCGMLLAQHGANVIKVEPTGEGDWARTLGRRYGGHTAYSIPANLGKRSDRARPEVGRGQGGAVAPDRRRRRAARRLPPGVLDRLGFGYEAVSKREPRILYLSVSGFGQTGPLSGRPAMDPVLQAFTGLMIDNKGEDGIPHRVPFVVIDMSTALYAFQALSAALYARRDEPRGRRIEVSLLQAASAMQVIRMMMVYLEGEQIRRAMPSGVFKTADGWLQFLVVRNDSWVKFCSVVWERRSSPPIPASPTRGPHEQRGGVDGHRPAGDRREADGLLVGATARSRHHARAAEHLP